MVLTVRQDVQQDLAVVRERLLTTSTTGLLLQPHLHDRVCLQFPPIYSHQAHFYFKLPRWGVGLLLLLRESRCTRIKWYSIA